MCVCLSYSHHDIIVVVFSNVNDANETTMDPETFTTDGSLMDSARDAYKVARTMPAAYRAILVEEEDWPETGIFTIGDDDTTSDNPPLRTGFAYRAFIRTYSEGNVKVHFSQTFYCYYH